MTFSILIAAYHAAPTLQRALNSVAAQTCADWELIVVEDGSEDGTEQIVEAFARDKSQPVRYKRHEKNLGVFATRTQLIELARGDALAFLDADDHWLPTHLSDLAICLEQGHSLVCSGVTWWDGNLDRRMHDFIPSEKYLTNPRQSLFEMSFIQTSSCVALPRAVAKSTGSFDATLHIGEDRDYWFRALEGGGTLGCTGAFTCRYTKQDGSAMTQTLKVASDTVHFYEKHLLTSDIKPSLARAKLVGALRTYGRLLQKTEPYSARRIFMRAWKLAPWSVDLPLRAIICKL